MILFLDTNVLLDVLIVNGRPSRPFSLSVFKMAKEGKVSAIITTQSIIDAAYVFSNMSSGEIASFKEAMKKILSFVSVVPIEKEEIEMANSCTIEDYEDACQIAAAILGPCNVIITGDKKFKSYTDFPIYTPEDFCKIVSSPKKQGH